MTRFERLDASTLGFPGGDPEVAVTVLTPRIVRVELTEIGQEAGPSYVVDREWGPTPFDVVDGTVLIYPTGASRFELYEDDGRTNAYRRGHYALTAFGCATGPGAAVTVRIDDAVGDRSVVPAGRRYLLRLRMDPPRAVTVPGRGELPRLAGPDRTSAGWCEDGRGFIGVRLPHPFVSPLTVALRT